MMNGYVRSMTNEDTFLSPYLILSYYTRNQIHSLLIYNFNTFEGHKNAIS